MTSEYLQKNIIIRSHQYRFQKFHSTEHDALHLPDYNRCQMNVGKVPINLYVSFHVITTYGV